MHPLETLWQDQQIKNIIVLDRFSLHSQSCKQKCSRVEKTWSSYAQIPKTGGYKIRTITCPNQPNVQSLL